MGPVGILAGTIGVGIIGVGITITILFLDGVMDGALVLDLAGAGTVDGMDIIILFMEDTDLAGHIHLGGIAGTVDRMIMVDITL